MPTACPSAFASPPSTELVCWSLRVPGAGREQVGAPGERFRSFPPEAEGDPLAPRGVAHVTLTHNGVWMGASRWPASTVKKLTSE